MLQKQVLAPDAIYADSKPNSYEHQARTKQERRSCSTGVATIQSMATSCTGASHKGGSAKPDRAGQCQTRQGRAVSDQTGQGRAGPNQTRQDTAKPDRAGQGLPRQGRAKPDRAGQCQTRPGRAVPNQTGQGCAKPVKQGRNINMTASHRKSFFTKQDNLLKRPTEQSDAPLVKTNKIPRTEGPTSTMRYCPYFKCANT